MTRVRPGRRLREPRHPRSASAICDCMEIEHDATYSSPSRRVTEILWPDVEPQATVNGRRASQPGCRLQARFRTADLHRRRCRGPDRRSGLAPHRAPGAPRWAAPGAPRWATRKPGHQEMDKPNMHTIGSARATIFERSANLRHNLHGSLRARLSRGASFGPGPALLGKLRFRSRGTANIGARFMADGRLVPPGIFVSGGATLSIGTHFYMNAGATIEVRHDVHIGNHVLMGPFASIIDDGRHEIEPGAVQYTGRTVIGSNVWLGRSVAVMPGVTIGDGSVIGANSVVTSDIPPDSFAAGAPARVIRKLDIPDGWVRR